MDLLTLHAAPGLGARHGFTTRAGGVSTGALATLNLAMRPAEHPDRLVENWGRVARRVCPGWGPERVAVLDQVHGAEVIEVRVAGGPLVPVGTADGAFTTTPGVLLAVRVADCVPVLVAGPGGVAVAHAGWRGTAAGVVPATIRRLAEALGVDPAEVTAVIGPCIGVDAYEVGSEVVAGVAATGVPRRVFVHERGARPHVDLAAAVAFQVEALGARVLRVAGDTTQGGTWFSHRRDGSDTGRCAGVVSLLPEGG